MGGHFGVADMRTFPRCGNKTAFFKQLICIPDDERCMKNTMNRFLVLLLLCSFSVAARAELKAEALETKQTLTSKQILLQQIDTVSLYLQTENIVYVPKYREKDPIQVKIFFLKKEKGSSGEFRDLALRHVRAFQSGLKERLSIYTPELASSFNGGTDLEFEIFAGTDRKKVAQVTKGEWISAKGVHLVEVAPKSSVKAAPVDPKQVYEEESRDVPEKKKCPAMIGGSKSEGK